MEFLRVSLVESNIQLKLNEHRAGRRRTQEEETTMDFSVKLSEEKRRPASWIMFMDHAEPGEKFEIHEIALITRTDDALEECAKTIVEALKKIPIWNVSRLIAVSQLNTMRRDHTSRRDEKILLLFIFIFPCNTASLASEVVAERARPGVEFLETNVKGSRGLQAEWLQKVSNWLEQCRDLLQSLFLYRIVEQLKSCFDAACCVNFPEIDSSSFVSVHQRIFPVKLQRFSALSLRAF